MLVNSPATFFDKGQKNLLKLFEEGTPTILDSIEGYRQDGETYVNCRLDKKIINLEFTIMGDNNWDLEQIKGQVRKVFNPKLGEGYAEDLIKGRHIKIIPEGLPNFIGLNDRTAECVISLIAFNPYWTDLKEQSAELAGRVKDNAFYFPFSIPETGICFGTRDTTAGDTVTCFNAGDVPAGMKIVFKSYGTVTNPRLCNVKTGEFMQLNKTLGTDETIVITTDYGNKKVTSTINGVATNAFNLIDLSSTFIQLQPGDNLFKYSASDGVSNLECYIYWYNKYLGV